MMSSIAILPVHKHIGASEAFYGVVGFFRHDTANGFSGEEGRLRRNPLPKANGQPGKDKEIRAMRELLLSDEYAESRKKRSTALC